MRTVLATVLLAFALSACTGATVGPGAATNPPVVLPTVAQLVQTSAAAAGNWSGTITLHGVINVNKSEPGTDDLPVTNTYHETWVTTTVLQLDATDTFTIAAADASDLTYGISSVDLKGSAANSGSTEDRYQVLTNKQNSGCKWKQDEGEETSGSWSGSGDSVGELQFSEDGSYSMRIRADSNGEEPQLPHHDWLKYSDITGATCAVNNPPYDNPGTSAPAIVWVSSHLEESDVNYVTATIDGQLNASNPGTTVDGTKTWQMNSPEGFTMTVTWHLVHSQPIVLPHA